MDRRKLTEDVWWVGAVDWDRRLFDALIPLPDGTSYNAYLVHGRDKTALLDTVDPSMTGILLSRLSGVERLDYIVSHHAEQDHSGSIPDVLRLFPEAKVLATPKARDFLAEHLLIAPERIVPVADGETIPLGGKTLRFIHTPWVHWPETMCTFLVEDGILFSCDFFGSHLAASLRVADEAVVYEAAKRYYAEIMMPFRSVIRGHLDKVGALTLTAIAPSHGPVHGRPAFIVDAYRDWTSDQPRNEAVVAYVSMHGSTALMAQRLVEGLDRRGVTVRQFNLAVSDIGRLAMALVDAATIAVGTPTVFVGPHPAVAHAVQLANALRPKVKLAAFFGSTAAIRVRSDAPTP